MLNSEMCNVRRYSKAILLCSSTNPEFMSLAVLYLRAIKFDSLNTGPFLVLFLLSEISDSTRLDLFIFKK